MRISLDVITLGAVLSLGGESARSRLEESLQSWKAYFGRKLYAYR